jgi:hypothetical protein
MALARLIHLGKGPAVGGRTDSISLHKKRIARHREELGVEYSRDSATDNAGMPASLISTSVEPIRTSRPAEIGLQPLPVVSSERRPAGAGAQLKPPVHGAATSAFDTSKHQQRRILLHSTTSEPARLRKAVSGALP